VAGAFKPESSLGRDSVHRHDLDARGVGSEEDVVSHHYTGRMDELRLEKGMRSPAWIAAQYRSMTAPGYVKVEGEAE
jgi:hypothetical protein